MKSFTFKYQVTKMNYIHRRLFQSSIVPLWISYYAQIAMLPFYSHEWPLCSIFISFVFTSVFINLRTVVHSTVFFLSAMVNVLLNSGERRYIADSFYLWFMERRMRGRAAQFVDAVRMGQKEWSVSEHSLPLHPFLSLVRYGVDFDALCGFSLVLFTRFNLFVVYSRC